MIQKKVINLWFFAILAVWPGIAVSATASNVEDEVRLLREQNALLQQQMQKQGSELDALKDKVQKLETTTEAQAVAAGENPVPASTGYNVGNIHFSAEGGVAFFNTGTEGANPHSDFRVDEARLFIEAPVWNDVYFYSDLDFATRENTGLNTQLGELYLDFEDVSKIFGKQGWLNIRAGRMDIPFGEEYLSRYTMENPLISHSVTDIWGIDPGVELYGQIGKVSYVVAVQNGGGNGVQDFEGDKSVAGRVSYDLNSNWHFSLSGMRTGNVAVSGDYTSALWFGNGWFHAIGSPATTKFHAELVEGDMQWRWKTGQVNAGHVSALGGYARYGDNDPAANNSRNLFYYAIEAEQGLPHKFYLATRFSQIFAPDGYPLVGFANLGAYYGALTTDLWRFSFGGGYRFSDRLALKVEYSVERGHGTDGDHRDHENFFGTEAVFKF